MRIEFSGARRLGGSPPYDLEVDVLVDGRLVGRGYKDAYGTRLWQDVEGLSEAMGGRTAAARLLPAWKREVARLLRQAARGGGGGDG